MSTTADDFLSHYGVKGMRWGKRSGGGTAVAERPASGDHKQVAKLRAKRPSEMSNEELRALTNRMNLEQQYSRLNPSAAVKGRNYVAAAIGTAGMAVSIYNLAKSPMAKSAMSAGKNAIYKYNYSSGNIPRAITSTIEVLK